jgi:hypothetical protein
MEPVAPTAFWYKFLPTKHYQQDIELSELSELLHKSIKAPNISLNGGAIHIVEIRLVALIAVILQVGVLIFDIFSVRNARLSKAISSVGTPAAGLPLTLAGTLASSIGVFVCACVMEARTHTVRWVSKDKSNQLRVAWLQKEQTFNDRRFHSCAIFADRKRHEMVTSEANWRRNLAPWVTIGTVIASVGGLSESSASGKYN